MFSIIKNQSLKFCKTYPSPLEVLLGLLECNQENEKLMRSHASFTVQEMFFINGFLGDKNMD